MKFRHNLLAIILLFLVGSVLAAQYHVAEEHGDASMRAGHRAEGNKVAAQQAAAQSGQQASMAFAQEDRSRDRARTAYYSGNGDAQAFHEQTAGAHHADGVAHQQAARTHTRNAAAHQNEAYGHFSNAEGHYQNAINGRINSGKAIDTVAAKQNQARAGKSRNSGSR